ncbi:MAG TPA: MdtA/MuxA family multidrug efflux RND transporter periplasmic adaptor subunit [Candidatus Acidoferrales bacterium]|nr:MdtA/MuxA family multidrug efflux RND transporter periplasmic adaptor subunit [Candidatus Acidoferrales bacterium]
MKSDNRTRKIATFVPATIALAGVLLASACNQSKTASTASAATTGRPQGGFAVPVAVAVAEKRDMPVALSGLGNVTALYTVNLKSRVDGQIMQVNFREGQDVKQGQLLVQVDPRPYQVALEQAKATLFKDQAQLTIQKRQLDRYQGLFNEGVVSREQLDAQESTTAAMEGLVKTDQAQVDNAQLNLTYCRVTAPISGRIGIRLVDPGNMVHANDQNGMLVITQLQPITVLFTLPEDSLRTVREHMRGGTLPVEIYSRDDQTKLATGKLETIDNQIDQSTGTVRLKAVIPNEQNQLWPNQFVNVHLLLDTRKNATVIPSAAIQRGAQGTYVFAVKSDNTVEIRPITTDIFSGNTVSIASGLQAGDQVVTDGQDKLQGGSKIQPTGRANASQNAGGTGSGVQPPAAGPLPNPNATMHGQGSGERHSDGQYRRGQ